jgi:hypothetical protein
LNGARVGSLPVAVAGVLAAVLPIVAALVLLLTLPFMPSAADENGGDKDGDGNEEEESGAAEEAG